MARHKMASHYNLTNWQCLWYGMVDRAWQNWTIGLVLFIKPETLRTRQPLTLLYWELVLQHAGEAE